MSELGHVCLPRSPWIPFHRFYIPLALCFLCQQKVPGLLSRAISLEPLEFAPTAGEIEVAGDLLWCLEIALVQPLTNDGWMREVSPALLPQLWGPHPLESPEGPRWSFSTLSAPLCGFLLFLSCFPTPLPVSTGSVYLINHMCVNPHLRVCFWGMLSKPACKWYSDFWLN